MTLLLLLRFAGGADVTGVPLMDIGRIARYDIGVPVFGLAALWLFNHAERRAHRPRAPLWYAASGAAVGIAGLIHMYGLFWLPVFLLRMLKRMRSLVVVAE